MTTTGTPAPARLTWSRSIGTGWHAYDEELGMKYVVLPGIGSALLMVETLAGRHLSSETVRDQRAARKRAQDLVDAARP